MSRYRITPPSPNCKICGQPVRHLNARTQGGGTASRYCSEACIAAQRKRENGDWRKAPRGKYITQKNNAKKRGIPFLFTFAEWLEFWGSDVDRIGKHPGSLVMGRYGDSGPYSTGNCYKVEFLQNLHQPPKQLSGGAPC